MSDSERNGGPVLGQQPSFSGATRTMYTCITCRVAFSGGELQRTHYKTEWHRYNLKRKVAELPPVSAEGFQERVLLQRTIDQSQHEEKLAQYCRVCRKHFSSKKSHESHLRSRKHKEVVAALERLRVATSEAEPSKSESCDLDKRLEGSPQKPSVEPSMDGIKRSNDKTMLEEDEGATDSDPEPLNVTDCLFCPQCVTDLETNLEHMGASHGFFIPDLEYLVDLRGLVRYLGEKVGVGNLCLYCNQRGKSFYSVEAVQHHMLDRCHCKLYFDGDAALEYAEFYDYSKSYPDHEEVVQRPVDKMMRSDSSTLVVGEDLELILPSGYSIGHRALKQFYKQRPPSYERQKASLMSRIMAKYRAIGWRSGSGEELARSNRNRSWAEKMRHERELRIGLKGNKQKHFRPQVIF